ncbi:hypothetical protein O7634_24620 [Micromonospora sp. WMMD1120]|uniref:hypothetical protein n=1 Tax=Micromonospora sp. WMMD1120 TaxID=3016106 RepID=UPI002416DEDC|nr:hypothetical protein [Micromonospora sp. WMMD1120]MDG4809948.1 hypothetical protein [Micromonospora sp. WMMD1120]
MTFNGWRVLVAVLLAALGSSTVSIIYSNEAARQSERKLCGVVSTLDDAYRQTPPQTPAGQKIARDVRQLRAEFGCPTL